MKMLQWIEAERLISNVNVSTNLWHEDSHVP